jgi:hypothetical protein
MWNDVGQRITARLALKSPIIVEGICLCQPLQAIDRDPDYWVWLENLGDPEFRPNEPTNDYLAEFNPISICL